MTIPPPDPESGDDILPWARAITRLLRQLVPRESADIWPEIGTTGTKYLLRRRPAKKSGGASYCWLSDEVHGEAPDEVHYVWIGEGGADFVGTPGCPIARFELDVEDPDRTRLSLISGSLDSAADGLFLGTQWAAGGYGYQLSYADGLLATYTRASNDFVALRAAATGALLHGYADNEAFTFKAQAAAASARWSIFDAGSLNYQAMLVEAGKSLLYGYSQDGWNFDTQADGAQSRSRLFFNGSTDYLETRVSEGKASIYGYGLNEAVNFRLFADAFVGTPVMALQLYNTGSSDFAEMRVQELLSQVRGYTAIGFEYLIKADDGESSVTLFDDGSANYLQAKVVTNDASLYGYAANETYNFRLRAHDTASPSPAAALQLWTDVADPDAAGEYLIASAAQNASGLSGYTDDGAFKYYLGAIATEAALVVRTVNAGNDIEWAGLKAKDNEASLFLFADETAFNLLAKATGALSSLQLYTQDSAEFASLKVTTDDGGEIRASHENEKNNFKYVDGSLQVWGKVAEANDIFVYLDLRDVETIKTANAAADLNIKFREIDVCDGSGVAKKQIFLASAMYDPPS